MVFENWLRVLTKPKQVFAEEKANASLGKALKIMFVAGVIAGIILAGLVVIWAYVPDAFYWWWSFDTSSKDIDMSELSLHPTAVFVASIMLFMYALISAVIGILINSGIYYIFAKLLNGKGNFTTQTYLIALFSAPCLVITALLFLIPFIGLILGLLLEIYALYLLTLSLKETHQYSTGKAVLTWLIPFIIVFVTVGIMIGVGIMLSNL